MFSADGWGIFLASLASRLYLGILLSLALFAVLPALLGWHGAVVQSGSMEPHISPGDVVLASDLDPAQPVPLGRVVQFRSPASAEPSGVEKTRLHRIVTANDDGTYVTAGDANADVDSTPLTRGQITGQARLLVPGVGLPGLWLGSGNFPPLALWSVITLAAVVAAVFGGSNHGRDRSPGAGGPAEPDGDGDGGGGGDESGQPDGDDGGPSPAAKAGTAVGIIAALSVVVVLGASVFSSAAFTAKTANAANSFGTAADWSPPSVTLANPGPTVRGAVVLTADAGDPESGIRTVAIQYSAAGSSTWTTLCTPVSAPFSCAWNTAALPDGQYNLRAVATDNSGLSATTQPISTAVANAFSVVLNDPGEVVRGTTTLTAGLNNPGAGLYTVRLEYSAAGANKWSTLCLNLLSPYNCAWTTTLFANGSYDLRAVAVSGLTTTYSATVADVLVDNTTPSVTLTDPGATIRGTGTFAATASDTDSGVAQVQWQYQRTGTSTWLAMCAVTDIPFSCRFDTTALANGTYNFRAVATDAAGNSSISTVASNRTVDNTVASASMEDPGEYLTGTVPLTAAANSPAGITSVRIQSAPAGTNTWTTRCTAITSPYSCGWNTTAVADGLYDFRAILLEPSGRETTSATMASRRVDNSPLRGADVQAVNGTGTAGRLDAGDVLTFTYSQQVSLGSVTSGWNGSALPVTLRLRDGNLLGLGNGADAVDIQRTGGTVNLGTLNTKGNFIKNRKTATFNATMSATTVTAGGVPRTVVTVTLGTAASGASSLRTYANPAAMVWSPTAAVTSLTGVVSSTAPATETGMLDRDF
ncbi:signal peptidase I [Pseudarthrobacter equi]|uniref:Signal peptidase I n=1 Tax=Pseudarthrobacter equi TaxID=728066 RepID=A0A1H2B0G7_9MICC|nr:Ig-like domain-containing protein [Pseudarthrobacter equi]SDT51654.1 signal peptidase I [Pseudarthrobacter equi]